MKIALLGYGKMGKIIETVAQQRGHEILLRIDSENQHDIDLLYRADVAIDFSAPSAASQLIRTALRRGVPVVSGTTGWLHDWQLVADACKEYSGRFFYSSNFSLGVNLFFALNRQLARLMSPYMDTYAAQITEIHHTQKLDAPSGTAVSLAGELMKIQGEHLKNWQLAADDDELPSALPQDVLPIVAIREGEVIGTHQIAYHSAIDTITIEHKAHSRTGFATGALLAAEWLKNQRRTGIYGMNDLLGISG